MKRNSKHKKVQDTEKANLENPDLSLVPHRKRGAQPGNTNAMAHGFYSRRFTPGEASTLDRIPDQSLANEFVMMRVIMHRALFMCDFVTDPKIMIRLMKAVNECSANLKGLVKLQKTLGWDPAADQQGQPLPPDIAGLLSPNDK